MNTSLKFTEFPPKFSLIRHRQIIHCASNENNKLQETLIRLLYNRTKKSPSLSPPINEQKKNSIYFYNRR